MDNTEMINTKNIGAFFNLFQDGNMHDICI
jgi:hypothetical protein